MEPSSQAMEYFLKICPKLYQNSDMARLPRQAEAKKVLAWEYNPTGLFLIGPSGTGKTRAMWMLLKRLILEQENYQRLVFFQGAIFALKASKAYGDPDFTEQWLEKMAKIPLLVIDDIFKGKMSEAQETAIYTILELRASDMVPTILTTNTGGELLLQRMTDAGREDRGPAIIRRIKDFCTIINFGKGVEE